MTTTHETEPDLDVDASDADDEDTPWEPLFDTLPEFVDWLCAVWEPPAPKTCAWCPQWWDHPHALLRLEALWRKFEVARQDPLNGIADWLRDDADHHLSVLTAPTEGPFRNCSGNAGHNRTDRRAFTTTPAPPGVLTTHSTTFNGHQEEGTTS